LTAGILPEQEHPIHLTKPHALEYLILKLFIIVIFNQRLKAKAAKNTAKAISLQGHKGARAQGRKGMRVTVKVYSREGMKALVCTH
jgi:hypothetical protein